MRRRYPGSPAPTPRPAVRAPDFWRRDGGPARLLAPLGAAWGGAAVLRRALARPWRAPVPVVCIGNLVAGGAGKTPLAIAVCRHLRRRGRNPHLLSLGYGGRRHGPVRVDPGRDTAREVGDEALLLAEVAPTWIARDRALAAKAACGASADIVVMDDGFQNVGIAKDLTILAIDGGYGFGNGRVMPAGPLREKLETGLARADAAVMIGADRFGAGDIAARFLPVANARIVPAGSFDDIAGHPVVAFAGIGRPGKFFDTLAEMDCQVLETHEFPDHHPYDSDEIMRICERAAELKATPVTTAKDAARLPPEARRMVKSLSIALEWQDPEALEHLLSPVLGHG